MGSRTPLTQPLFVPDYHVKAVTDVLYLRIKRATYSAALKATKMSNKRGHNEEQQQVLDRYLEKVDEDDHDNDHDHHMLVMSSPKDRRMLLHQNTLPSRSLAGSGQNTPNLSSHRLDAKEGNGAALSPLEDKNKGEFWGEDDLSTTRASSIAGTENSLLMRDLGAKAANAGGGSSNGPASLPKGSEDSDNTIIATVGQSRTSLQQPEQGEGGGGGGGVEDSEDAR
jgi:hypothetical protein